VPDAPAFLVPLLDYLAAATPTDPHPWHEWTIRPVGGAGNNLLYRAGGPAGDFAVKFTIRDARDRAGREYEALCVLRDAGLALGPQPVWLDRDRYAQPVVVQTWLDGPVSDAAPETDAAWQPLLAHLAALRAITPQNAALPLRPAVLTFRSAAEGVEAIHEQLALIPPEAQPASLQALVRQVAQTQFPSWPVPPLHLCRCDLNLRNFIRRPAAWASVDWEYSGWGDLAYESANLLTHPTYMTVTPARRDWVLDTYAALCGEPDSARRSRVYYGLMLVWWVARLARNLYDIPRGRDARLVAWPANWQDDLQTKYNHYVAQATAAFTPG
jgi:hypothetical protein